MIGSDLVGGRQGQYEMFDKYRSAPKFYSRRSMRTKLTYLVVLGVALGLALTCFNVYQLDRMKFDHQMHLAELAKVPEVEARLNVEDDTPDSSPVVWIQGSPKSKNNGPTGYLKHVFRVFTKLGFTTLKEKPADWAVLWSHDYPFTIYGADMKALKPYQRVNHLPGSGYITNKVSLAQTQLDVIPRAFELPMKKKEFLAYTKTHPDTSWVQKNNRHRGIQVKAVAEVDLSQNGTFVQEFVAKPYLIDGRKFDIGVYTVVTSVDPLRVYTIDGDALFRFCPQEYYPFDSSILDKYVVGDDYTPMWQLPSLEDLHVDHEFSFKNTFNEYLSQDGKDHKMLWRKIKEAIQKVFHAKEKDLIKSLQKYRSKRNFFEMVRFDFVIDENLNVFLMEANMSPNLSSDHFPPNERLYEHVIFNMLGLVGVAHLSSSNDPTVLQTSEAMHVSAQDIFVYPDLCNQQVCGRNCKKTVCKLCKNCLSTELEIDLKSAYLEHIRRGTARRTFPPPISPEEANGLAFAEDKHIPLISGLNLKNQLMYLWFIGKCRLDPAWCY